MSGITHEIKSEKESVLIFLLPSRCYFIPDHSSLRSSSALRAFGSSTPPPPIPRYTIFPYSSLRPSPIAELAKQAQNLTMYDLKSYYTQAKNMVLNISDMEAKVREATNDDTW